MDRVLLISGSGKGRELFGGLLREQGLELADAVSSGVEGRRMLAERDYDVILINCPLTDEYGTRLACFAAESTAAGVLLLCREEQADEIAEQVEQCGVLTVPKPVNRAVMHQTLRMAGAVRRRLAGAQRGKETLRQKMEEIRLVDRAKCALIQYLSLTEPMAHRYIEKEAMDRRVSRREVAEGILRTYEG